MIEIIPAIDIIDGKCVRLNQGDYAQKKVYNENPLEVARSFEDAGLKRLHLVDLDGAKASHIVNHQILESIATNTSLTIDFGGGLKSDEDLRIAFESGAAMVTGGSIAIKSPEVFQSWLEKYGNERIILGADAHNRKIAVSGWQETTDANILDFIALWQEKGVTQVISTDISRDGMLSGPATELYRDILNRIPELYLIASGGISSMQDILDLDEAGIPAVITGKAIYENRISLKEIGQYYAKNS
ncbi:1-(5-phosphoribosyl)-5-[(5-phosphoribosylamino)methylideneamino]imidazole-4-carboxamide isomerase [Prolixibacter denitrificans]|uniref:1-(5-phosphoribosyl)-5-[(5-phosphoribosylamino)methylideneamino] imidazole-4-carboxamide isomerase n=1 Tax=Prolixibacter denitrificans TaxID=1541063 RepID=A0A2P8CJV2_9BACT|nr:1-(5-phosphoribosyl)-5-[(5-phosphoribosylamino)methylideneamino]imidazole-4-carboxamide isomerase [Prolixibacter denitrificans]PSK85225.1 phosphoribosylformimino-5-aminoimidazole carboxamide ribotide isomerase [Prolixibacter denitrificans]GET19847.1 1-(5-phosphoribosyl)-5-[(5-phosphoribosylamino) methylideneamino] imidazole-4-carboxamide isomerase [Prolixibacter denitrificans]